MKPYILTIDQGTTSTRTMIFDHHGHIISQSQIEIQQLYPHVGYVNHDPHEIWQSVQITMKFALEKASIDPSEIESIGITNQRETTIIWDKRTGKPISNAIVWQSRQTQSICDMLKNNGHEPYIKEATGLVVDPYFSASKIMWLLEHVEGARQLAQEGHLAFGTVDSFLMYQLTGKHMTDISNASRTMLYNIHTLSWDHKILSLCDIPISLMPEVKPSIGVFSHTLKESFFGYEIPIGGVAGDQQASLFGHLAFEAGMVKNTYGTGCFILMQTGKKPVTSNKGLLTTIAWSYKNQVYYALEGSVFVGGSAIQWLRDGLHMFEHAQQSEALASSLESNEGVYVVPAFVGLGTPYWDSEAKGAIFGITRATKEHHLARASLEAIAYQSHDVIEVMKEESKLPIHSLKVDGGATKNDFLMQFQSDISRSRIERSTFLETTALGVFYMAGLSCGLFKDLSSLKAIEPPKIFTPIMSNETSKRYLKDWHIAVQATRSFKI
jgi:glycerol kinase